MSQTAEVVEILFHCINDKERFLETTDPITWIRSVIMHLQNLQWIQKQVPLPYSAILLEWIERNPAYKEIPELQELTVRFDQWRFARKDLVSAREAETQFNATNLRTQARGRVPLHKVGRIWVTSRLFMGLVFRPRACQTIHN